MQHTYVLFFHNDGRDALDRPPNAPARRCIFAVQHKSAFKRAETCRPPLGHSRRRWQEFKTWITVVRGSAAQPRQERNDSTCLNSKHGVNNSFSCSINSRSCKKCCTRNVELHRSWRGSVNNKLNRSPCGCNRQDHSGQPIQPATCGALVDLPTTEGNCVPSSERGHGQVQCYTLCPLWKRPDRDSRTGGSGL